jgi:hypothetical protein
VLHATERGKPRDRDKIDWKLITDLPINSRTEGIEKLNWYAMRWKIETYHKILKSGCKAEDSKLRTAERLAILIAMSCILDAVAPQVFIDARQQLLRKLVALLGGETCTP